MKAFKLRLEQALGSGAALALLTLPACGGSTSSSDSPSAAGGDATSTAGVPGTSGATSTVQGGAESAGTSGNNQQLAPFPESAVGCSGPSYGDGFGYHGQCCAEALCYTPDDGSGCVEPDSAPEKLDRFYGSGSCLCGGSEPIQGPFANNPAHEPQKPGTCCYVISSIGCDGRPLLVDGAPVVSALVGGCAWLSRDLLEVWA